MNYYRSTRKAGKKNENYECNNDMLSLTTKENENTESQKARKEKIQNMAVLISKFHNIVSQGPLNTCSCCDQLWYKHSAFPAAKIRKSNHAAEKYLLKTKSVINQEWLCRPCHDQLLTKE